MRKSAAGAHLVQFLGIFILTVMSSAMAVDVGYYFAAQNRLQTATDAAALASTDELYRSNALDPHDRQVEARMAADDYVTANLPGLVLDNGDVTFGMVDPVSRVYNETDFESLAPSTDYAMTGGVNAVRVVLKRTDASTNGPLKSIIGKILGVNTLETGAFSVALLDRSIASVSSGLRPIYACQAQLALAMQDGIPENNVIRVYGDRMEVDGVGNIPGCPPPGSGNWGFSDLRNCQPDAPGASDTARWFRNGFDGGPVYADQCYSTQTGNFIVNNAVQNALDELIANRTVISIPVYDTYSGGGSNTKVNISGFTGFVITGYQSNGSAQNRHITGYFTKSVCTNECTTAEPGTGDGGLMVKLRLASQS